MPPPADGAAARVRRRDDPLVQAQTDLSEAKQTIDSLSRELGKVKSQRLNEERAKTEAERRAHEAESKVEEMLAKRKKRAAEIKTKRTFARRSAQFCDELERHHPKDLPRLLLAALKRLAKKNDTTVRDFVFALLKRPEFKEFTPGIFAARDHEIYQHLRTNVYTPAHFALLRLVLMISKRECNLICQSLKHKRTVDGKKERARLAPDSKQYAPPIFDLADIMREELAAEVRTQVKLHEHADRRGADVSGAPYSLDRHVSNLYDAAVSAESRSCGMATCGDCEDPDILCFSGDGAGASARFSEVRAGFFYGSTEKLSQSSMDFTDILVYLEECGAESYITLKARLAHLQPQLRRIYKTRHLRPGGVTSERYTDLCLVADKPFIRHITGKLSHNADCFGAPSCSCTDAQLLDFTKPKKTHYSRGRGVSYERCCAMAHVPVWEALGDDEPDSWSMTCDVCKKTWTQEGGWAQLEAERARYARMDPATRAREEKKHADKHEAQNLCRAPLVPFHHVVFDPMHGIHCEVNALLDEAVHKPLCVGYDSKIPEVKATCEKAASVINKLWHEANLPKYIQWGKSKGDKGKEQENGHAMNGPTFKKAWANGPLLVATLKAMEPVWALKEVIKSNAQEFEEPEGSDSGAEGAGAPEATSKKPKKAKKPDRGSQFDLPTRNVPNSSGRSSASTRDSDGGPSISAADAAAAVAAAAKVPFAHRVGVAILSLIYFYEHITAYHGELASKTTDAVIEARADKAIALAIQMQRAMVAVCGTRRRRTYAHDLVYGIHQLYTLFKKPWGAATEGSEHKHQDVKRIFQHLVCHNGKGEHGCAFEILRLELVKENMIREYGTTLLPQSEYVAMRVNRVMAAGKKRGRGKKAGPKGEKVYTKESGLMLAATEVAACSTMRGASPVVA